jgi:tetratricopeptide (TPR) repeat protein
MADRRPTRDYSHPRAAESSQLEERFHAAWKAGSQPEIDQFIGDAVGPERAGGLVPHTIAGDSNYGSCATLNSNGSCLKVIDTFRGAHLRLLGQLKLSLKDLNRSIELNDRSAVAISNLGHTLSSLGRRDDALKAFSTAIKLDPNDSTYLSNRGHLLEEMGRYSEALVDFGEAIRTDPNNLLQWTNRANFFRNRGDYDRAIEDYDEAIRRTSDLGFSSIQYAYGDRAQCYLKKGEVLKALEDFSAAIDHDPDRAHRYTARGQVYLKIGNLERARKDYDDAVSLDPTIVVPDVIK